MGKTAKRKFDAEKEKAIVEAIRKGHEFWKDHPSLPNQSTYDLALWIKEEIRRAGFKIVKA
tara:strand:+ start:274 stop:456 length:183 start_codon:yes stop_codon:yes gene_type:complete